MKRLKLWIWERRLAHARVSRRQIINDSQREITRATDDVSYCETMVARARMALVEKRADAMKRLNASFQARCFKR